METPKDTNDQNETANNNQDGNANTPTGNGDVSGNSSGSVIDDFLNTISGGVVPEQDHADDAHLPSSDTWFKGQMRVYGWNPYMHFQLDRPSKEKQYTPFNAVVTPEIVAKWIELAKADKITQASAYGSAALYFPCEIAIDPDNPEKGFIMRLDGERYRFAGLCYDHGELTTNDIVGPVPTY